MELEAQLAVELGRGLAQERAVGVEPRHLVLVLVGHQLEQVARDRLGEPALARRLRALSARRTPLDAGCGSARHRRRPGSR